MKRKEKEASKRRQPRKDKNSQPAQALLKQTGSAGPPVGEQLDHAAEVSRARVRAKECKEYARWNRILDQTPRPSTSYGAQLVDTSKFKMPRWFGHDVAFWHTVHR